ncbi:hypothetical protein [Haliscomenobacter sp.]|uniref:hypothetical protein n=1 Tax=Haliscomenobacter sp. TaxID=2717303 RepID=UPI003364D730
MKKDLDVLEFHYLLSSKKSSIQWRSARQRAKIPLAKLAGIMKDMNAVFGEAGKMYDFLINASILAGAMTTASIGREEAGSWAKNDDQFALFSSD